MLQHAEMNNTEQPLIEGAWRPTMSLAIAQGFTDPVFLVVGSERTDVILTNPPAELPPCGGQPKGWMPG